MTAAFMIADMRRDESNEADFDLPPLRWVAPTATLKANKP
jgi:hypothetical protein